MFTLSLFSALVAFFRDLELVQPCFQQVYLAHFFPTATTHFVLQFGNSHIISSSLLFVKTNLWSVSALIYYFDQGRVSCIKHSRATTFSSVSFFFFKRRPLTASLITFTQILLVYVKTLRSVPLLVFLFYSRRFRYYKTPT